MRLQGLLEAQLATALNPQQRRQLDFAEMLLQLGTGTFGPNCVLVEKLSPHISTVYLPIIPVLTSIQEVLAFVYPDGFQTENIWRRAVMACTNTEVDRWNESIQEMNPAVSRTFYATNEIAEIDDLKGVLRKMITPEVLQKYNVANIPPHELTLKVGDICLIVRTIQGTGRYLQLSTNTRVRILDFRTNYIRIQTLSDVASVINIPRILFKFRLPYGPSFYLLRKQYPLRLAYSMTINKSQGQEFAKAVVDTSTSNFAHGFSYVSASRVRDPSDFAFYNSSDSEDQVHIQNVVYHELLSALHE
jgi:ATP-dependent exoDNAse (exonuclease V) alpha subunit